MTNIPQERVLAPRQGEIRCCWYCRQPMQARRARQDFCGPTCRKAYHNDVGAEGIVAGVTRLKRAVSVVIHFADGPAAERAMGLRKGSPGRWVADL